MARKTTAAPKVAKMALALAAMERINSEKGLVDAQRLHFANEIPSYGRISTGILSVDLCMGGSAKDGFGIPRGAITVLTGAESSYKTTTLLRAAAGVQRDGGVVVWLRAEGFDAKWAEAQGVDVSKVLMIPAIQAGDKALENAVKLVESGGVDLLVGDSIQGFRTSLELDETELGEGGYGNGIPQMWGAAFPRLARAQSRLGGPTAIALTSQVRSKIGGYSKGENTQGSQIFAVKHWKDIDQLFRKGETKYSEKEGVYGRTFVTKNIKNKTAVPEQQGEFDVYFRPVGENPVGYDEAGDVLSWALRYGVVGVAGSWLACDGSRYQGKEALKRKMRESPELLSLVRDAALEASGQ